MPWPKEKLAQWRKENREHVRETKRAYYAAHPEYRNAAKEKMRIWRFQKRYGITPEEYERLKKAQGGLCALCRKAPTGIKRLCVDHDHETLRIRGLLCVPCNSALGTLGDNAEGLRRALAYVSRAEATSGSA